MNAAALRLLFVPPLLLLSGWVTWTWFTAVAPASDIVLTAQILFGPVLLSYALYSAWKAVVG